MTPSKVVFDIVNSVKGGSGKSTIALNLAVHCVKELNSAAYIIDLDLRGTSWEANFESLFDSETKARYIHDEKPNESLLYNAGKVNSNDFRHISFPDDKTKRINLCICNPKAKGEIDDPRADFLLSTVYRIIEFVCDTEQAETVHIILDMPPSYERHAERVLEKLLLDKNSALHKSILEDRDISVAINMLMIYALSPAHLEQNILYVESFIKKLDYSSLLSEIMAENGDSKIDFQVFFVGNNINNINIIDDESLLDTGTGTGRIIKMVSGELIKKFAEKMLNCVCSQTVIIPFMSRVKFIELSRWGVALTDGNGNPLDSLKNLGPLTNLLTSSDEFGKEIRSFPPYSKP